jgi:hypothetical protein
MASLLRDNGIARILMLGIVVLVAAINIVAIIFFGNYSGGAYSSPISFADIVWSFIPFCFGYILAPAFIGLRVAAAPRNSHVFLIAFVTCVLASILLLFFFKCGGKPQCNLYKFINIPVFWVGAFVCLFPEKNEH